jgi:hypothetical protein
VISDNTSTLSLLPDGYTPLTVIYFAPLSSYRASRGVYTISDFKWNYIVG